MYRYLLIGVLTLSTTINLLAQKFYTDETSFRSPLDIPLVLSGTFGELRSNHFHSGIDIKTQGKEGLKVYAVEDGYVSRIKLSHWGYGKAVYITHPNGYTSVYGHLSGLNAKIDAYIRKIQYQRESYQVEAFPSVKDLPVRKGEVIAYSGNTGGSGGPHLHFEIRETNNQWPMNPLLFGFKVNDHKNPVVRTLFAYPVSDEAQINKSQKPLKINLSYVGNDIYEADTVYASGRIGFAVNTYDNQDGASNKNGVFSIEMTVDGILYFYHDVDKFSFSETKYINKLIDYAYYKEHRSRLQKCFIEPSNRLKTYKRDLPNNGLISVQEGDRKKVNILIKDLAGNSSKVVIPVIGQHLSPEIFNDTLVTEYFVPYQTDTRFDLGNVTVDFQKYTFYEDDYLHINKIDDNTVAVHQDVIPLKKRYNISFDLSGIPPENRKHHFVAYKDKKGELKYISSSLKGDKLVGRPKRLGTYMLVQDFKAPEITPVNFVPDQWLSKQDRLVLKIDDELSGIKSYRGTINGKFILFEWDYKTGLIQYQFSDQRFPDKKHDLEVVVTDYAGNTKTYNLRLYH